MKQLWTDNCYLSFFNDGTIGISDGVGYSGSLNEKEVMGLYRELQKYFEKSQVVPKEE